MPAPKLGQCIEERFVGPTIAQGLIRANPPHNDAWMQPMDPADERFVLHRVTAELIEKNPHLNDSYLGDPVEGHAGWFHTLPYEPTLAGWVCGHYLTVHQPTGSSIGYAKVFREVEGKIIEVWVELDQNGEPKCQ